MLKINILTVKYLNFYVIDKNSLFKLKLVYKTKTKSVILKMFDFFKI